MPCLVGFGKRKCIDLPWNLHEWLTDHGFAIKGNRFCADFLKHYGLGFDPMPYNEVSSVLFYRPQRSCGQGNIFCTCLSFCSQEGGGIPEGTEAGPPRTRHTPPGADPPGKQTPAYGLRAASMHPTGMHSCHLCFFLQTRMHSSRMRTGHSLTVCWSLLPRGVSALVGGVCSSGGCLLQGGVCSWGVSVPGGWCLLRGCVCGIPACTEADNPPPLWTEWQTSLDYWVVRLFKQVS